MRLLERIVGSFTTSPRGTGIPIGNLTSQLFANIYLNEFDQFMKNDLHIRHFVRYTDDFVVLAEDKDALEKMIPLIRAYLQDSLRLDLHPRKVSIRTYRQGIDFLGYVLRPHHRLIRTRTKRRMFRKFRMRMEEHARGIGSTESVQQSLQSYLGVLSHADAHQLGQALQNQYGLWVQE